MPAPLPGSKGSKTPLIAAWTGVVALLAAGV